MQDDAGQTPLQMAFYAAIGLHQSGNLIDAEKRYREVLSLDPRHSDAIHYLGVIAHQTGKNDVAAALIGAAIEINDKEATYYANLALALSAMARFDEALAACDKAISRDLNIVGAHLSRGIALNALGRFDEAVAALNNAVRIDSTFFDAYFHLGLVLRSLGRLDEARESFDTAVRIKPAAAEAHFCLAAILDDLGRWVESVAAYSTAHRLKPDYANAYCNLAGVLNKLSRHEEAVSASHAAIKIKPDFPGAYTNLGTALLYLHRNEEALDAYKEAIRLRPEDAQGYFRLGFPLFELDRLDEAIAACDTAIRLKPEFAEAHANRAIALRKSGRLAESLTASARAIEIKPDYPSAHFNESIARLLMGDFAVGLKKYEWRYRGGAAELKARSYSQAQWIGQEVRGLTVLLYAEQGLGDSIQFCRYVSLVKMRGARVVLEVPRHLLCLLAAFPGVDQFVATGDTLPEFDFHCPLMSLPYACGTTVDSIPAEIPYLHAQADVQKKWEARLGAGGFKIGIAWQGSPTALAERGRSTPLACFEPLSKIPGVRLISLQKGHGIDQLNALPEGMQVETLSADFDAGADAFIDTAALMMSLDLVITVDTAIGHLAGALGRPVWIVLQKVPHWIWMMDRTDSPWYHSVRLFRQNERGNWPELFGRVTRALREVSTSPNEGIW